MTMSNSARRRAVLTIALTMDSALKDNAYAALGMLALTALY